MDLVELPLVLYQKLMAKIYLSGQVLRPDGSEIISGNWEGTVNNPIDLGTMAGNEIKEK